VWSLKGVGKERKNPGGGGISDRRNILRGSVPNWNPRAALREPDRCGRLMFSNDYIMYPGILTKSFQYFMLYRSLCKCLKKKNLFLSISCIIHTMSTERNITKHTIDVSLFRFISIITILVSRLA
jgi:hypothetical protein